MTSRPRRIATVIVTIGLLVATGCSSGSSGWTKVDLHGATSTSTATAAAGQTTVAAGSGASPGGQAPGTASGGTAPGGAPATSTRPEVTLQLTGSYCTRVEQLATESSSLMAYDDTQDPATQLAAIKKSFATVDDAYRQMQESAPAEIATDVKAVVAAFHSANLRVQQLTSLDESAITSILSDLQTPALKAQSDKIGQYTTKACGIDPQTGATS